MTNLRLRKVPVRNGKVVKDVKSMNSGHVMAGFVAVG
jgi:hypothetical protein